MVRTGTTLAITGAAALVLVAAVRDWAQSGNEANVQFHGFQDSRGVTVLTPSGDLSHDFTDRTNLRINFGVDAISAASDSCARCHRSGVNSHRRYVGVSATEKFDIFKWTFGGAYSQENFYRATTGLTSLSRDLNNANTTVAGGFAFSLNQPTLHPNEEVRHQYDSSGFLSVTQTLTKSTIAQVGYELTKLAGYLDNPFLRANVNGIMVLGQVPDSRLRQTFSARVRQALPANTFLEADYRHYVDDWQVQSDAVQVGLTHRFSPKVEGGGSVRAYWQTGASFYQPAYEGPIPQYFTADFRLQPFTSGLYTGRLRITPKAFLGLPSGSSLMLQYEGYRADNGFQAAIFSTGVRVPLRK